MLSSCSRDGQSGCARAAPLALTLDETIPRRAELTLFLSRLHDLPASLHYLDTHLAQASIPSPCQLPLQPFALDPCAPGTWEALGADLDKPAILTLQDHIITLRLTVTQSGEVISWARALAAEQGDLTLHEATADHSAHLERQGFTLALTQHREVVLLSTSLRPQDDVLSYHDALLELDEEEQWFAAPEHRLARQQMSQLGELYAVIRPGALASMLPATQDATRLQRARISAQLGSLAIAMEPFPEERRTRLWVAINEELTEPTTLHQLEGTQRHIPDALGALIEPGVLGGVRLSVTPDEIQVLLENSLPHPKRQQLHTLLDTLKRDFALDAREAVIDNLEGDGLVVLYGLEPQVFKQPPLHIIRDVLMLRATHEVIYLPIKDPKKLTRFLDAVTQLTRNRLQRQSVGETLQYAWSDEDILHWAVIIHGDVAMLIDSTAAFDHVMRHVDAPKPMATALTRRGVPKLLGADVHAGLYLDFTSIRTQLPEESKLLRQLLASFKSAVLTSKPGKAERTTRIEVDLWH